MSYNYEIHPKCEKEILKFCKNNKTFEQIIKDKMSQILEYPEHYKPLKYDLAGERRVHIFRSYVLKFEILEKRKTVKFIYFGHHDDAYRR